ncbi:MAG: crossover junction endodeoxyribonuclease RuvC [Candidatus Omnitrophota bacterium]
MIVVGIDVGLKTCGCVVCEMHGLDVQILREDEVRTSASQTFAQKLDFIFESLRTHVDHYRPHAIIVEKLYSHYRHPATLGILAQVRGVVVLLAQRSGVELFEYSPTRARKSFLGKGGAKSFQVKKMAENICQRPFKSDHTADAFSLVITFAHMQKVKNLEIAAQ